jgi:hypothetical protein
MVVMRIQRAVVAIALGVMALTTAACSSGTTTLPVGKVCGVTALAGGPPSAVGVQDPALLRVCPSGRHEVARGFSLMASNGKKYKAYTYNFNAWFARVPAGTYRAVDRPGCRTPGRPFVVRAGKTLKGVVVWLGCDYS